MTAPLKRSTSPKSSYTHADDPAAPARKKSRLGSGVSLLVSFVARTLTGQPSSHKSTVPASQPSAEQPPASQVSRSSPSVSGSSWRRRSMTLTKKSDSIPRSSVSTITGPAEGPLPSYRDLYDSIKASRNDQIMGESERRLSCVHGDFVTQAGDPSSNVHDPANLLDIDENVSGSSSIGKVTPQPNITPFDAQNNLGHMLDDGHEKEYLRRPYLDEDGNPIESYPAQYGSELGSFIDEDGALVAAQEYDAPYADDDGNLIRPPIISLDPRERYHLLQLKKAIELAELEQQKAKYVVDPHETHSSRLPNGTTVNTAAQTHDLDELRRTITSKRKASTAQPPSAPKRARTLRRRGFSPGDFMYDKSDAPKPKAAPEPLDGYLGTIGAPKFSHHQTPSHKLGLESSESGMQMLRPQLSAPGKINLALDSDYVAKTLQGIKLKPLAATDVKSGNAALPSGAFLFGSKEPVPSASNEVTATSLLAPENPVAEASPSASESTSVRSGDAQTASSGSKPLFLQFGNVKPTEPQTKTFGVKPTAPSLFAPSAVKSGDPLPSKPLPSFAFSSKPESTNSQDLGLDPKRKRRASNVNTEVVKPLSLQGTVDGPSSLAKPVFSFGAASLSSDKTTPSFSFGKPQDTSSQPKKIEEVKETQKPLFSFGNTSNSEKNDAPIFGKPFGNASDVNSDSGIGKDSQQDKESVDAGSTTEKPSLFGASQAKPSDEKPTFSFGGSQAKSSVEKPAFSFGSSTANPGEDKPAFTFGGKQSNAADDKPALSSGESQADLTGKKPPTFSFGGASLTKPSDNKPAFSFGDVQSKPSEDKPTISFGGSQAKSNEEKPAFSFGGSQAQSSEKPVFSFGGANTTLGAADSKDPRQGSKNEPSSSSLAFNFGSAASKADSDQNDQSQTAPKSSATAFSFDAKPTDTSDKDHAKKPLSFTFGAQNSGSLDSSKPAESSILFGGSPAATKPDLTGSSMSSNDPKTGATPFSAQGAKSSITFGSNTGNTNSLGEAPTHGNEGQAGSAPVSLMFGNNAQLSGARNTGSRDTSFQFAAGIKPSEPSGTFSAPISHVAKPSTGAPSFNFANSSADPATIFGQAQSSSGPGAFSFGSTAPVSNPALSFAFGGPSAPANGFGAQNAGPVNAFGAPTNVFGGQSSAPASTFGAPANTFGAPANSFGGPVSNTAPSFNFGGANTKPPGMVNNGMMMPQPTHQTTGLFGANAPPAPFAFNGAGGAPGMPQMFPGQAPTPPTGRRLAIPRRRR